jgi:hypothetical protein
MLGSATRVGFILISWINIMILYFCHKSMYMMSFFLYMSQSILYSFIYLCIMPDQKGTTGTNAAPDFLVYFVVLSHATVAR